VPLTADSRNNDQLDKKHIEASTSDVIDADGRFLRDDQLTADVSQ
jgi:hypothetical protein